MRHSAVVAWLHIVSSVLLAGGVVSMWIAAAELAELFAGTSIPRLVAFFGKPVGIALLSLAAADVGAAIGILCGWRWPRAILTAFGLLTLWAFPVGTALAAYTVWALWFAPPDPPPLPPPTN